MNKSISLIGVPMDLGQSRRGVDMGPSALRIAQVGERLERLGFQVTDRGNISVKGRESLPQGNSQVKYRDEIAEASKRVSEIIYKVLQEDSTPVIFGGDHSIAMGSVAGISKFYNEQKKKIGVIWFDAHADINTPETSASGNVHGMPVAHILGVGAEEFLKISALRPMVDPKHFVYIGLRDLDPPEKDTIRKLGVKAFTMRDLDELGMKEVCSRAIEIASNGTAGFHVSFDMDAIDPSNAPGVGTPAQGGISYREAHLAMEMIFDTKKMISIEVTEVNPVLDHANKTAQLATEMILSAFGNRIL
ncbi:MAG: arginase [Deltaproteobacteria bacterium]|nr:arginase [Deltaproteobacteria bacterium]